MLAATNTKSGSKGMHPEKTGGFHLHSLIDPNSFDPRQNLDVIKRKHNLDPENAVEAKKKKSLNKREPKERNSKLKSSCQVENNAKFRNEGK